LNIAATGIVIGIVLGAVGGRFLRSEVASMAPGDPIIALLAATVLLVAAAIGAWVPARQAVRVDPAAVLRGD
jgi:ABC-type antimicrobial peptide transport system permease subunit